MQYLISETSRRRKIQNKYNMVNKITPKTIFKSIEDIKLTTTMADGVSDRDDDHIVGIDESKLDGIETKVSLDELKRKMLKCARNLQFEEAVILRDKIKQIENGI